MKPLAYLTANVFGRAEEIAPPEGYGSFSAQQAAFAVKTFRDEQVNYKHGSGIIRVEQQPVGVLRAMSRRQSAMTSAAEAWCLHAVILPIQPDDYLDENIERFLRYPYASETEIVRGVLPDADNAAFSPVHDVQIEPDVLEAVLFGCLKRWTSLSNPVYIAFPDAGFEETSVAWLRAYYLAMPISVRAHVGYLTNPNRESIPEFTSICLIPESRVQFYRDEPILYPNTDRNSVAIEKIRSRSDLPPGLKELITYICRNANRSDAHLQNLFRMLYRNVEGNGDIAIFANIKPATYGAAFTLLDNWQRLTDIQKDDYIFSYVKAPSSEAQIDQIARNLFQKHMSSQRFKAIVAQVTQQANYEEFQVYRTTQKVNSFSDYCLIIKTFRPFRSLINYLKNITGSWNECFLVFADFCCQRKQVRSEWSAVYEQVEELFDGETINLVTAKVQAAHDRFVAKERLRIDEELSKVEKRSPLAFFSACSAIIETIYFVDDHLKLVNSLVSSEAESMFKALLFADESALFPNHKALQDDLCAARQSYPALCSRQLEVVWNDYDRKYLRHQEEQERRAREYREAQENLSKYFIYVASGKQIDIIPEKWSVHEYLSELFVWSRKGWSYKMSAYDQNGGHGARGGSWSNGSDGFQDTLNSVNYQTDSQPQQLLLPLLWGRAANDWHFLRKEIPLIQIAHGISSNREQNALLRLYSECEKYSVFSDDGLRIQFQGKSGSHTISMQRAKELIIDIDLGKVKTNIAEEISFIHALQKEKLLNDRQLNSLKNKPRSNQGKPPLKERFKENPAYTILAVVAVIALALIVVLVGKGLDKPDDPTTQPVIGAGDSIFPTIPLPDETTTGVPPVESSKPQVVTIPIEMAVGDKRDLPLELGRDAPVLAGYDLEWARDGGTRDKSIVQYSTQSGSYVINAVGVGNALFIGTDKTTGERVVEYYVTVKPKSDQNGQPGQGVDANG